MVSIGGPFDGAREGVEPYVQFDGLIPGGRPEAELPDSAFDPNELAMGIEVEMEHTTSRDVAREIAKVHLTENGRYYTDMKRAGFDAAPEHNVVYPTGPALGGYRR